MREPADKMCPTTTVEDFHTAQRYQGDKRPANLGSGIRATDR
jgi:hypothetical protein